MKKIIYIISLFTLFASCDYLDVKPVGKVIPEKVTEFRALLTSGYNTVSSYKYLLAFRSDEVIPIGTEDAYAQLIDFAIWNDNSVNMMASYPWSTPYKAIFYANSVIADVMDAEVDTQDDSREQILGEAYLLRAYMHFDLLNLYGIPYNIATAATDKGIPLALKIDIEQSYTRATVEKVYEQIFADIAEGQRLLTVDEQESSILYRFSKKSAKAFEARVRLYHQEWENAMNLAEELLPTCPLEDMTSGAAMEPYNIKSHEAILCLEEWGSRDISRYSQLLPTLQEKYNAENDYRFDMNFTLGDGGKYEPTKGGENSNYKVSIRSAEIYLIAAEAAVHVEGKLEQAKTRLKELLKTRLKKDYYLERAETIDRMSSEELLVEIMNERARELALEGGHRWFDLRRTNRPEIVKVYTDDKETVQSATLMKDDPRYTISLPQEATENNPDLRN
ncbi:MULTISPECIES: RagB/SusD family nutrient uptake outer membrane protein [Butyricimonas]|jgi:probable lipoprotein|uniref:RagB/SusD family nutrient uptake outer membrane protein n=1 Tax=Butyricimonas hominis TaxID=2763032 RepID=A0ABR7D3D0_9BACT|nr:RagB/SusD family nutrient uptake outer membrane protein [Butyricimonas hominis]MBC5622438.1 RagB/SusD family nutrient uptake outer membrane protein [Butyricimonas hominis]